jgi:hypothetical protein
MEYQSPDPAITANRPIDYIVALSDRRGIIRLKTVILTGAAARKLLFDS